MPQFHKRDEELTEVCRAVEIFKDPRSYITSTGCQKLFGEDWAAQANKIIKINGNRCYRCGEWRPRHQLEVHHIKHRGQGGCDCEYNLRPLCGIGCHRGKGGEHA